MGEYLNSLLKRKIDVFTIGKGSYSGTLINYELNNSIVLKNFEVNNNGVWEKREGIIIIMLHNIINIKCFKPSHIMDDNQKKD